MNSTRRSRSVPQLCDRDKNDKNDKDIIKLGELLLNFVETMTDRNDNKNSKTTR